MPHLVTLAEKLLGKGIGFRSLQDGAIDTTTASGELMFNIFSSLAQFERRLIQELSRPSQLMCLSNDWHRLIDIASLRYEHIDAGIVGSIHDELPLRSVLRETDGIFTIFH